MNSMQQPDEDIGSSPLSRAERQQQIQQALSPFEDDLIAQLPTPDQIIQAAQARQQHNKQRLKKAMSLAVLAAIGGVLYLDPAYDEHILTTAMGEQQQVILKDGSQLNLNTDTIARVSYHLRSRQVELQQGEATFHVKHNAWYSFAPWLEREFSVDAGHIEIEDIGTVFNVNKRSQEDVQVSVLQGQVRVHFDAASSTQRAFVDLTTGQSLASQHQQLSVLDQTALRQLVSWQKGVLYFNDQPLSMVLHELNRYGTLPIRIENESIGALRISGQVDVQNREQFIQALPSFMPIRLKYDANQMLVIQAK